MNLSFRYFSLLFYYYYYCENCDTKVRMKNIHKNTEDDKYEVKCTPNVFGKIMWLCQTGTAK